MPFLFDIPLRILNSSITWTFKSFNADHVIIDKTNFLLYKVGDISQFWLSSLYPLDQLLLKAFVLFLLTIVLSVLRFTDSDYPFGIFKLFLNYLAFQSVDYERTWWMLFQKGVLRTKFDIYVFYCQYLIYDVINIVYIVVLSVAVSDNAVLAK
jgi:hypothetical protein